MAMRAEAGSRWRFPARIVAAIALTVAVTAGVRAQDPNGDAALLRIEQTQTLLDSMKELPARIAAWPDRKPLPEPAAKAAETAAASAFDVDATSDVLSAALADLPDAPGASGLQDIASRFDAAAAELGTRFSAAGTAASSPEAMAVAKTIEQTFAARSNKAKIEDLVGWMASPKLHGEANLTAGVLERALMPLDEDALATIRAADETALKTEVDSLLSEKRASAISDPASRDQGELEAKAWLQSVLTQLSEEDVARLHAFYGSPEGRAKRDALVAAFAKRNEQNTTRMLLDYLGALKASR